MAAVKAKTSPLPNSLTYPFSGFRQRPAGLGPRLADGYAGRRGKRGRGTGPHPDAASIAQERHASAAAVERTGCAGNRSALPPCGPAHGLSPACSTRTFRAARGGSVLVPIATFDRSPCGSGTTRSAMCFTGIDPRTMALAGLGSQAPEPQRHAICSSIPSAAFAGARVRSVRRRALASVRHPRVWYGTTPQEAPGTERSGRHAGSAKRMPGGPVTGLHDSGRQQRHGVRRPSLQRLSSMHGEARPRHRRRHTGHTELHAAVWYGTTLHTSSSTTPAGHTPSEPGPDFAAHGSSTPGATASACQCTRHPQRPWLMHHGVRQHRRQHRTWRRGVWYGTTLQARSGTARSGRHASPARCPPDAQERWWWKRMGEAEATRQTHGLRTGGAGK